MKFEINYTLLADGSSDMVLIPIINWTLRNQFPTIVVQAQFAKFALRKKPKTLEERIKYAIEIYPCDVLFVHRDAENMSFAERRDEIQKAWDNVNQQLDHELIGIVPVRMTEAWLLINESAIKVASGNPNSQEKLSLPAPQKLENKRDPKDKLHTLIKRASNLRGRNLDKLNTHQAVHLVAENISDYTPLRDLNAFQKFEDEIQTVISTLME